MAQLLLYYLLIIITLDKTLISFVWIELVRGAGTWYGSNHVNWVLFV